jgi:tetratricopeptide (TPR) repeat protein
MKIKHDGRNGMLRQPALLIGLVCGLGVWTPTPAQRMYSIQAGAYPTLEAAEQARAAFSEACSPTFIATVNDSTGYEQKVRMGHFATYADAWVYKTQLSPEAAPGGFIVSWDYDGRPLQPNQFPIPKPFQSDDLIGQTLKSPDHWELAGMTWADPVDPQWVSAPVESLQRDELLAVGLGTSEGPACLAALERFLEVHPADAQCHRVRLRLARMVGRGDFARADLLLGEVLDSGSAEQCGAARLLSAYSHYYRKDYAGAYERFCLAANNPDHAPTLRRDAMRRAAAIAHKLHRYPEAWLAFQQIEQAAADAAEAAEARMQKSGLAVELVGRGKGRWEEARALCASVVTMPGVPRRIQSTAALMHLETYYHENRLTDALDGAISFMELYPDCTREYRVAQVWRGIILAQLHQFNEALVILQDAASTPIAVQDTFAGLAPRARAALWLAWVADLQGDQPLRDQWVQFLETEYPETPETSKAHSLF